MSRESTCFGCDQNMITAEIIWVEPGVRVCSGCWHRLPADLRDAYVTAAQAGRRSALEAARDALTTWWAENPPRAL